MGPTCLSVSRPLYPLCSQAIATSTGSTSPARQFHGISSSTPFNLLQQQTPIMDSMPIRTLSVHEHDYLKVVEPSTDAQHVENVAEIKDAARPHLPKGVSETVEENPIASHQIEFENIYPDSGWHEHDPQELVDSVEECIEKATEKFLKEGYEKSQIKAIGITNQRETTICWDTNTGEPLYNAIVWPDTRTTSIVRELKKREGADKLQEICGLPISTYPSSVKLLWLYRNVDAVKKAYDEGRLSFGTVDTWLIYKLNGGKEGGVHVTDSTNASRTMFMNLHTLDYDDKLLDFFQLDRKNITLPKIVPSSDKDAFGALASTALKGIKITGCLGDQSAALVGQCGFSPGVAQV